MMIDWTMTASQAEAVLLGADPREHRLAEWLYVRQHDEHPRNTDIITWAHFLLAARDALTTCESPP